MDELGGDNLSQDALSKGDKEDFNNNELAGNCNLIVNYLPHDIDDSALRVKSLPFFLVFFFFRSFNLTCPLSFFHSFQNLFEEFGEIVTTKVVRDKNTKKSLGYGFVKFAQEYNAMVAMEKMNGSSLGHKVLKVSIARPPSLEIRNCKLYVTNLPKEYTEMEVISLFKEVKKPHPAFYIYPLIYSISLARLLNVAS